MEDLDGSVTNGGGVEETRAGRVGEELPRVNDSEKQSKPKSDVSGSSKCECEMKK